MTKRRTRLARERRAGSTLKLSYGLPVTVQRMPNHLRWRERFVVVIQGGQPEVTGGHFEMVDPEEKLSRLFGIELGRAYIMVSFIKGLHDSGHLVSLRIYDHERELELGRYQYTPMEASVLEYWLVGYLYGHNWLNHFRLWLQRYWPEQHWHTVVSAVAIHMHLYPVTGDGLNLTDLLDQVPVPLALAMNIRA